MSLKYWWFGDLFFLGNFIEVKCFSCLLNLFSVYSICKILDMLQRCLLLSRQIVTSFQIGILYLFLVEQSYVEILHHHYEIKRGNAGAFGF